MIRRIGFVVLSLLSIGLVAAWWLSRPLAILAEDLPDYAPDPVKGERVFWAGGCASCHATPVDGRRAAGQDKLQLGGGMQLDTPFGIFRVPNISSHETDGIGRWSMVEFVNAMQHGVSPSGEHYYPSFPYPSYARMDVEDVMDLRVYLETLPAVGRRSAGHSLSLPWSLRRGVGLWKRRYMDSDPVVPIDASNHELMRGREIVEGVGHCGECHSPRDRFGGPIMKRWLAGAASLEGQGRVPNITRAGSNVKEWTQEDIVYYLESGFTPDFDTVGGTMVAVQENMAMLPASDREAVAAYLKYIPAVE